MNAFKLTGLLQLKVILSLPVFMLMAGCLDENIFEVSREAELHPSYSLPIGPVTFDINDYLEELTLMTMPWPDSLYYGDVLYPNYRAYIPRWEFGDYDLSMLSGDIGRVEQVTFHLLVSSDYPTLSVTQVYFADGDGNILDSAFAEPYALLPAETDADGVVIAPREEIVDITMSSGFVERMEEIRQIIIESIIYTTQPDVAHVKFYSYYAYRVNIALRIQFYINTGEL